MDEILRKLRRTIGGEFRLKISPNHWPRTRYRELGVPALFELLFCFLGPSAPLRYLKNKKERVPKARPGAQIVKKYQHFLKLRQPNSFSALHGAFVG